MAQESAEPFLVLLTLSGEGITPLRVVGNTESVVSGGNTYQFFPFEITLPEDSQDERRPVTLTVSNVDLRIIDEIRTVEGALTVEIKVIMASTPNTIEVGPFEFKMRAAEFNENTITGTLAYESNLDAPFPGRVFDPQAFPALFGRL